MISNNRFNGERQHFGDDHHAKLRRLRCAVVGVGELGTHVAQQLAFLGVGALSLVGNDDLDGRNRNLFTRSRSAKHAPERNVELAARLANAIDPSVEVCTTHENIGSGSGFNAVISADYVFGCLNFEGVRYYLNDLCSSFGRPYIDLATETHPPELPGSERSAYGGRILANFDGNGCLACMGLLDDEEVDHDLKRDVLQRRRNVICLDHIADGKAILASVRSVIASVAVTEFMVHVTGVRPANRFITYNGTTGSVTVSQRQRLPNCWYCAVMREKRAVEPRGP